MVDKSRESHLSFDSIARLWFEEDGAPGETRDEILQLLVSAMWRGEFERDGISVLALPPRDHLDRLVERTGLYRNEFDKNIERQIERVIL